MIGSLIRFALATTRRLISLYISLLRLWFAWFLFFISSPFECLMIPIRTTIEFYRSLSALAVVGIKVGLGGGVVLFSTLTLFIFSPSGGAFVKLWLVGANLVGFLILKRFGVEFLTEGLESANPLKLTSIFLTISFSSVGLSLAAILRGSLQQRLFALALLAHFLFFFLAARGGGGLWASPAADAGKLEDSMTNEQRKGDGFRAPLFEWNGKHYVPHFDGKDEL